MKSTVFSVSGILLALVLLISAPSPLATAQEMEVIAGGELDIKAIVPCAMASMPVATVS